jgi:hypothetical protein
MFSRPLRPEIDNHTSKLIVGIMALYIAGATSVFSEVPLHSISASYHEGGWSRDIFVGFLFAISAFLVSYNGKSPYQPYQTVLSKVGALAAVGIAMFPCKCGDHAEIIPYVHGVSAAIMFFVLAFFCLMFVLRASNKTRGRARLRAYIYAVCGVTIVFSILVILIDNLFGGIFSSAIPRLTFYGEAAATVAFGIAWLTASRTLPLITTEDDRIPLFSDLPKESVVEAS